MDIEVIGSEANLPRSIDPEWISQKPAGDAIILRNVRGAAELSSGGLRVEMDPENKNDDAPDEFTMERAELIEAKPNGEIAVPGKEVSLDV